MDAVTDMSKQGAPEGGRLHKIIVLLCHAGGGEPIRGKARMQKLVFMLSHRYGGGREMGFEPGAHGPYSKMVEEETRHLEEQGILSSDGRIEITKTGRKAAEAIANWESDMLEIVERYKEMFNDMSEDEILAYICATYPDMAKSSAAYDSVKSHMERHVMSMLRKQKITSGKAADMLDKSREYIMKKAAQEGIPVLEADAP